MRKDTERRSGLRTLLAVALIGIAAQAVGRLKVIHAVGRAQDLYAILTVAGVVVTSFSVGAGVFIFARTRMTGALSAALLMALALCLVLGLVFFGIYWPWMFGGG
jgi:hypothetical protein